VVEGYAVNQRFIIAQDPIPQNIDIFWRCIFDNDIKCVVMIGDVSKFHSIGMQIGKVTKTVKGVLL